MVTGALIFDFLNLPVEMPNAFLDPLQDFLCLLAFRYNPNPALAIRIGWQLQLFEDANIGFVFVIFR